MNHFPDMMNRVSLQNISTYFQTGCIQKELDSNNLEEREDNAVRAMEERIKRLVPESCYRSVVDVALEYANNCCEIYFTVGMKAGAKLEFQLLNDSLKDN